MSSTADLGATQESWLIHAEVEGREMTISVGDATQSVTWLGAVAISRWDEDDNEGWRRLGVPSAVLVKGSDTSLNLESAIRDCLRNGDTVVVKGTLSPNMT